MIIKAIAFLASKARELKEREEGLALTEYVVVLGLLVAGVIVAVLNFGGALGEVWQGWANWLSGDEIEPPGGTAEVEEPGNG